MTLRDWMNETSQNFREEGAVMATRAATQELWQGALKRSFKHLNYRPSVWERDWDVLVILDACRVDALRTVVDRLEDFPSSGSVQSVISPASTSPEFMRTQFQDGPADEKGRSSLICANPHSDICVDTDDWAHVNEVWRENKGDGLVRSVTPRPVTDAAIAAHRDIGSERMIIWYVQPHFPARNLDRHGVLRAMRDGDLSYDRVWTAYLDNLEWVLNDVSVLLENLDADTLAITSDHGEAFGEFGVYGHAPNIPVPSLKKVPWMTVSATDTGEYEPDVDIEQREITSDVDDQLSVLGYK